MAVLAMEDIRRMTSIAGTVVMDWCQGIFVMLLSTMALAAGALLGIFILVSRPGMALLTDPVFGCS